MRIAIPVTNGRLHGHFGGCRHFALVDVDVPSKSTLLTQVLPAPDHQPGLFPRWLSHHGVHAVIAGGIGHRALDLFARQGITVRAGDIDATVEQLVADFLEERLTRTPPGCDHHDPGHGHGHHGHEGHDLRPDPMLTPRLNLEPRTAAP